MKPKYHLLWIALYAIIIGGFYWIYGFRRASITNLNQPIREGYILHVTYATKPILGGQYILVTIDTNNIKSPK